LPTIVPNWSIWAFFCHIKIIALTSLKFRIWWHFINSSNFLPWKFQSNLDIIMICTRQFNLIFLNYW
jgi:hypothetical protein